MSVPRADPLPAKSLSLALNTQTLKASVRSNLNVRCRSLASNLRSLLLGSCLCTKQNWISAHHYLEWRYAPFFQKVTSLIPCKLTLKSFFHRVRTSICRQMIRCKFFSDRCCATHNHLCRQIDCHNSTTLLPTDCLMPTQQLPTESAMVIFCDRLAVVKSHFLPTHV